MVKCAMSRYQAAIYNWVKSTGTLRLDPNNALAGKTRHPFVPLNNKVMELRKVRRSTSACAGLEVRWAAKLTCRVDCQAVRKRVFRRVMLICFHIVQVSGALPALL